MSGPGRYESLFAAIDGGDVEGFSTWITEDCAFTYGSNAPVRGVEAVGEAVRSFLASFASVEHRVDSVWEAEGVAITEGTVSYTATAGNSVTVPFCNVLRLAPDGRIRDYRVYVDPSPLG